MTNQKPEPFITIGVDSEAIRRATARIGEQLAAMRLRSATHAALAACLDQDDDRARQHLTGLGDAQLYAIEGAGSALAIHASRLRRPAEDQPADPPSLRRRVAELRARAQRAEAEAADWRTTAQRYERERDTERRRAESSEEQDARHMRYLNDARDAAGAPDWPSLAATIRALRARPQLDTGPVDNS
ncbi:hypothetical protein [Actinomadura terrae]|uniref:hypothetical protein n=1 Tax=Actinomadura terrae TaxID=604353 RepID=UPI001FA79513|nr:hypothetical protein [Actinomadura terrae]